jgi:hypothetical protein
MVVALVVAGRGEMAKVVAVRAGLRGSVRAPDARSARAAAEELQVAALLPYLATPFDLVPDFIEEASNPSRAPDGKSIVAEGRDGPIVIDLDGNSRPLFPYSGTQPAWQPLPT